MHFDYDLKFLSLLAHFIEEIWHEVELQDYYTLSIWCLDRGDEPNSDEFNL